MDRYGLKWLDPYGRSWDLTSHDWTAGIRAGGVEGLVGDPTDVALSAPGFPGQVLDSQQFPPLRGTLRFAVRGDGARPADDVWAELRQSFHHRRRGTVVLNSPLGSVSAVLRRGGAIPPPQVDPSSEEVILGMDVPSVVDDGCWWMSPLTGRGVVTVTNPGDVPVWVKIRWTGEGGTVILPSGATFVLPPVSAERVLNLSSAESLAVTDIRGVMDEPLWRQVRGMALPEMIPAGESRTFTLPEGAEIEWKVGVLDPWQ